MNIKNVLKSFLLVFLISFSFSGICHASEVEKIPEYDKNVLVIQSYNRDYIHSQEIETGITEVFQSSGEKIRLYYEFMDTKNYMNDTYLQMLAEEYQEKYAKHRFDGIILCDDDALNFYIKYGKTIWPDTTTVIATGINSVTNYENGVDGIHIIEEQFEYEKNIELALEQNSDNNIKRLNFIYDVSTTGDKVRNDLEALTEEKYTEYEIHHYYDKTPEELKEILNQSDQQDLFFFTSYIKSSDGRVFNYEEVPRYLFEDIDFPVYGFIKFYLGTGVFGGYMVSSKTYGEKAAQLTLDEWSGETIPPIIFEGGESAALLFDYNVLKRLSIKDIPSDAVVINHPVSYFEKNKKLIGAFSVVIFALSVLIVFLGFVIYAKSKEQRQTDEINRLNLNLLDIQKDIVLRLGEVIETRSNETANHVERVAKISGILARECGLSELETNLLVMISPMHDIGKIGIPEEILNKPGKLTPEEFEVIKTHPQIGYKILKNSDNEILKQASIISLEHHERYDGMGYPRGLKGKEISMFARITSLVDVYDALRSERIYKKAWSYQEAEEYIIEQGGQAFDPEIVDAFIRNVEKIREVFNQLE